MEDQNWRWRGACLVRGLEELDVASMSRKKTVPKIELIQDSGLLYVPTGKGGAKC